MTTTRKKTEIIICLGSSCFARGNKHTIKIIQIYLKEKKLEDRVVFRGKHCFGHCESGPALTINGKVIEHVTPDTIIEVLDDVFYA